jgi:hemerythrin-like domain-containing protein
LILYIGNMIKDYLETGIKEVIEKHPPVADVLKQYDIGCVSCGLGTCLLKDVVEIHNLSNDDETALMKTVFSILYPGQEPSLPVRERKAKSPPAGGAYSPPIKKLVDEHLLIKRLLALIPGIVETLDVESQDGRLLVKGCLDFIQSFADRFHHAKEEQILFKCFDENLDIIKTMCADHENARARVRRMLAALERHDGESIKAELMGYQALLAEHIKKEDEILYRWMEKNLSMTQIGELFARFREKEQEFGDQPQKYAQFIQDIEIKV